MHTAWSFDILQILFGPHGDGEQGSFGTAGTSKIEQ